MNIYSSIIKICYLLLLLYLYWKVPFDGRHYPKTGRQVPELLKSNIKNRIEQGELHPSSIETKEGE